MVLVFRVSSNQRVIAMAIRPDPTPVHARKKAFMFTVLLGRVVTSRGFVIVVTRPFLDLRRQFQGSGLIGRIPLTPVRRYPRSLIFRYLPPKVMRFTFLRLLQVFTYARRLRTFVRQIIVRVPRRSRFRLLITARREILRNLCLPNYVRARQ